MMLGKAPANTIIESCDYGIWQYWVISKYILQQWLYEKKIIRKSLPVYLY